MKRFLGIEFGSTRIKAVCIDEKFAPVSSGEYTWKSEFKNGIWTYDLSLVSEGLKTALANIKDRENISAVGISGMMHGYLAFDNDWNLLTPFRTWQNTITAPAAKELSSALDFNIPQRWSIAHLYQAVLNGEEHLSNLCHITTLSGYVHFLLTGENVLSVGEASGVFPIDSEKNDYDEKMLLKAQELFDKKGVGISLKEVLPRVLVAGEKAGVLTKEGTELIDNMLPVGTPFSAPEGDAGTGMVATNAVAEKTGNVSAGTSIFSMVVLEKPLKKVYEEIDIVTTPSGKNVAMVHCNNCTADSNAWVSIFKETLGLFCDDTDIGKLYEKLYKKSLEGENNCGGVTVCNFLSGESIVGFGEGRPFIIRNPESNFTLANFMRATIYSSMVSLKIGMEILDNEGVNISSLMGHGGLFKTEGVAQRYLASALKTPVTVMKTAGEGGPFGMAVLAAFVPEKGEGEKLEDFLNDKVFKSAEKISVNPEEEITRGFEEYTEQFKKALSVEKTAVEVF